MFYNLGPGNDDLRVRLKKSIKPTQSRPGWSDGAKVLGKLPVPGRHTILITVG